MRCIKRAANRILTAGLALCLLLPCAAPAATALETPDWMLVWSHTRTSSVIAQLEKDQFTAEITVDGVNGVVEMVRSNGKMYLKASKPDGTQVLTLLLREGAAYQLDSSRRLAIHLGDENAAYAALGISGQTVERSLATGKATGFAKAEKTVDGKTYDAEIFRMQLDGKPVEMTYCYDENGTLRCLITSVGGKQASMEYREVSDEVDESLLELPEGYTVCTRDEDGSLRDAAGRVVA